MSYQFSDVRLEVYRIAKLKNRGFLHISNYRDLEAMSQIVEKHANFVTAESAAGNSSVIFPVLPFKP